MSEREEAAAKAQYEAVTGKPWEDAPPRSANLCREDSAAIAKAIDAYDAAHGVHKITLSQMSGMAEVLAAHQWYDATIDNEDPATGCTGCPEWFGSEDALDDGSFANHQAFAMTAAGFGDLNRAAQLGALMAYDAVEESALTEAKAQALDEAADAILTNDPLDFWSQHLPDGLGFQEAMSLWLKAHAAAVRGEG